MSSLMRVWPSVCTLKRTFDCRRQAFDANMTRDYVLNSVSMDNPELVAYIREVQLKPTTQQDPSNATQTTEERNVASLTEGKREGVYVEYISRVSSHAFLSSTRLVHLKTPKIALFPLKVKFSKLVSDQRELGYSRELSIRD